MVFGEGEIPSPAIILGESPGPTEEKNERPFFHEGESGKLLDKLLAENALTRSDFFITNAVVCPPLNPSTRGVMDGVRKAEIFGNTTKDGGAIHQCNARLHELIELVEPRVVVCLGAYSVAALLGKRPVPLSKSLGWQSTADYPFRIFVSYHPSYYLRQKSAFLNSNTKTTEERDKIAKIGEMYREHWQQIAMAIRS